jgi:hypothetical protein
MSLKNDDIRIAIATILTNVHADYVLTNAVAHEVHKRCVEFILPATQTTILASLDEDWWFISNVLEDRYVTAEFRKRDTFLTDVEIEGRRSHKKQCESEMASTRLGANALYRESEAKEKAETLNYGDAPYQYSQKEAVDLVNKIILEHSIANAQTNFIEYTDGTGVEISFTSWGTPMLVAIDPVWAGGKTPKIALFENYSDTPTYITNGAGGYTKPRAIRWFMEKFDHFLSHRDEKNSNIGAESIALEAEAEKLRGEFNEEIRENEAMAPADEGTLVGNLDHVRKADKILEKAEENCVKDIQDKAVEIAEERGYTDTAEKIKSEGLFSEMKKCQLKSADNCKLCCFGKSCPQSLLNAAMRPIKPKPKAKKVEADPNWLNVSDAVEALFDANNVSFTTESMSGGNYRISAHEGDKRIEIRFKLNPDLTNDVTLNRWKDGDKSPYDETMIPVRDTCSCNHLLNTVLHYIKDLKEADNA